MSLSGLPLASFSLFSRSIVPPVINSTCAPVCAVNFLPMMLATISRQLPPQTLTTSLSCAAACIGAKDRTNAPIAKKNRFMLSRLRFARHRVDARSPMSGWPLFVQSEWLVQPLPRAAGGQGGTSGSRASRCEQLNREMHRKRALLAHAKGRRRARIAGLVDAKQEGTV